MLRFAQVVPACLFLIVLFILACASPAAEPLPTVELTLPPPAAPSDSADAEPAADTDADKTLTLLYWQAPSLVNSYLSGGTKDTDAGAVTLEPLAHLNPDGQPTPALAAEIPTVENGDVAPDGRSITWRIKEGLLWSDGSRMTAGDVVFTWNYCVEEHTGCAARGSFRDVASVEALDDLTVKITFATPTPYPYGPFVGAGNPIISRVQFADCIGEPAGGCDAENHGPLGTGPYRVTGLTPNERAEYERNPHYRGPEPYFDRVVIQGGGEAVDAARAVLEEGAADFAWNLQIEPETLSEMAAAGDGAVVTAFSSTVERIVINHTNPDPALGDNRSEYLDGDNAHPFLSFLPIRQAMSMAIDRNAISERLYGFAGRPTCNLVDGPPQYVSTANDDCLTPDVAGAIRLLDGVGVLDTDGDGIREYQGVPLRIVYQTSTNDVRQATQEMARDWWREIGIEAELVHHDASVFFGGDPFDDKEASLRRFYADVQMYATGVGIDAPSSLSNWLCDRIPTPEDHWGGSNVARYCNPEYDRLHRRLEGLSGGAERVSLTRQLNDIVVQDYAQIPLVNRGNVSAHLNTLRGVRINGWDSELWNIAEWRR